MKSIISDYELIDRLHKGDVEAFNLLYKKYSGRLYAFGLKYLRSTDDAEELVQSVFVKVWENYKNLKKEASFKSYLFTITFNDICKLFRKRSYKQKFINDTIYEKLNSSNETEDTISYRSFLEQVDQIIDMLPEKQKNIFLKSRHEGKSTKEIAEEVNLSPGTIDNYISESLKVIRSGIKKGSFTYCTISFVVISLIILIECYSK